eukprot:GHRR01013811.1.p1 GENE.GHRR01013811.1~~GHRR01013811.1.p1  ORF type:complete len:545 (+),score=210.68 GHRR01013811.1:1011-2645(+)
MHSACSGANLQFLSAYSSPLQMRLFIVGCMQHHCTHNHTVCWSAFCILYVQDGVVLADSVTATHALLCEGVVVSPGATIQPGVVLSYGVVIGTRHTVPSYTIVSLCKQLQLQVSLSDDELEYASAGRSSSGGGRAAAAAVRRRQTSSAGGAAAGRQPHRSAADSDSSSEASNNESSSEESDDASSTASSTFGEEGKGLEKPSPLAVKVAQALASFDKQQQAAVAAQAKALAFDVHLVGKGGAGYGWPVSDADQPIHSIAPPPMRLVDYSYDSDAEADSVVNGSADGTGGLAAGAVGQLDAAAEGSTAAAAAQGSRQQAPLDPETMFMQEVGETFLRCVKERFAEVNAVIELNGLKIAEDRTFADCARYIFTSMMQLCLPAPAWVSSEYRPLFSVDAPDSSTKEGKLTLLARFKQQLTEWGTLLRRFLKSEDDQVELLLTLEEYCSNEGVFEVDEPADEDSETNIPAAATVGGAAFAPVFANLLQLLYDNEVIEEAAITSWAAEKEHADESEKLFLQKSAAFLEWLKTADEEEGEDSSDENDSER